jgi:preprotein translocase subunit YajC
MSREIPATWLNSRTAIGPNSLPSRPIWVTDPDSQSTTSPRWESGTISAPEAQTIVSVNGGQTVYITVTHDFVSTTAPQQPDMTLAFSNKTVSHKARDGTIAGGIVGGLVIIYAAFFVLSFIQRRKTAKKRKQATLPPPYGDADMSEQLGGSEWHR